MNESHEAGFINDLEYFAIQAETTQRRLTREGTPCAFPKILQYDDFDLVSLLQNQYKVPITSEIAVKDIKVFIGEKENRDPKIYRLLDDNDNELMVR